MERGRPTIRTPEIEEAIVGWIASGKTLREFCRQEGAPGWRTVYDWLDADPEFSARFARARRLGMDAIAEETMAIADTPESGEIVTKEGDKVTTRTEDMIAHRKLRVWARLQLLAKWDPKRYGDKSQVELSGPGGSPVQTVGIVTNDPAEAARAYQDIIKGA